MSRQIVHAPQTEPNLEPLMTDTIESRLSARNIVLPEAAAPAAIPLATPFWSGDNSTSDPSPLLARARAFA